MKHDKTPVWEYLPGGFVRAAWIGGHVCTKRCLRFEGGLSYCNRYSYRPSGEKRRKKK